MCQLTTKRKAMLVAGLLALVAAIGATYEYTKVAYRAVGFNDGGIDTGMRVMQRLIEAAGGMPICTDEQQRAGKEIVSVKAEAIYAIASTPGLIALCKAR